MIITTNNNHTTTTTTTTTATTTTTTTTNNNNHNNNINDNNDNEVLGFAKNRLNKFYNPKLYKDCRRIPRTSRFFYSFLVEVFSFL